MADSKRLSLGGRVPTPQLRAMSSSISMDQVLTRCIGAKIRVHTAPPSSRIVTGYIFALSPSSPVLTITPLPVANGTSTTSYTLIALNSIQNFTLLELAPSANAPSQANPRVSVLPAVDPGAIQNRLDATTAKLQAEEARLGKGVSAEGQAIFDALSRTLGCRWDGDRIVVIDSVVIEAPYRPNNCKAGKGVSGQTLPRIKKVLESEWKKLEAKGGSTKQASSNLGLGEKKGG